MTLILIKKRSRSETSVIGRQRGRVEATPMDSGTLSSIVWGTVLFGLLIFLYFARYRFLAIAAPNRQIIRDMLSTTDYQITEAENGEEALAAVASLKVA